VPGRERKTQDREVIFRLTVMRLTGVRLSTYAVKQDINSKEALYIAAGRKTGS
jgi:hypothetical protein